MRTLPPGGTWSWTNMGMVNSPLENIMAMCVRCGPDRLHVLGVFAVIGDHFNSPTVRVQTEMVRGLIMREAHRFIAMFFDIGLMLRIPFHVFLMHGARLHILCCQLQTAEQKNCYQYFHDLFLLLSWLALRPAFFTP